MPRPEPEQTVERAPFAYATIRVVPRVEREEFVNAGIVLFSARGVSWVSAPC